MYVSCSIKWLQIDSISAFIFFCLTGDTTILSPLLLCIIIFVYINNNYHYKSFFERNNNIVGTSLQTRRLSNGRLTKNIDRWLIDRWMAIIIIIILIRVARRLLKTLKTNLRHERMKSISRETFRVTNPPPPFSLLHTHTTFTIVFVYIFRLLGWADEGQAGMRHSFALNGEYIHRYILYIVMYIIQMWGDGHGHGYIALVVERHKLQSTSGNPKENNVNEIEQTLLLCCCYYCCYIYIDVCHCSFKR